MKTVFFSIFISILYCSASLAQTPQENRQAMEAFDRSYTTSTRCLEQYGFRGALHWAALLYERNAPGDSARAEQLLLDVMSFQTMDERSNYFGQIPPSFEMVPKPWRDRNLALFFAPDFFVRLWPWQSRMSSETRARFLTAARNITIAAERRWNEELFDLKRDHKYYSNVFIMYVRALLMGGVRLNDERLIRTAQSQWNRWFNHLSYYGIDEFASPAYNEVEFESLIQILDFAPTGKLKNEVSQVLDYLTLLQAGLSHPTLGLQLTGMSRDYRKFHKPGNVLVDYLNRDSWGEYRKPTAVTGEFARRNYPYEASGRAGTTPFLFKTYQTPHAGMGSMTGGYYFWQQIHCIVAVGKSAEERETAFLQGSYTPINGYVDQQKNRALCVFSRQKTTYHTTQLMCDDDSIAGTFDEFGIGVTPGWKVVRETDQVLVLEAYGHELHIAPFRLDEKGRVIPIRLTYKERTKTSHRYHPRDIPYGEYCFPDHCVWMGCTVEVIEKGKSASQSKVRYLQQEQTATFASEGLTINLFLEPSGGITELYSTDWRTLPLWKSPVETLWPGQMRDKANNVP